MCALYLSMNETDDTEKPKVSADLQELGALCRCTLLQTRFAASLLEGHNYTEAAFLAGYAGARDSVQLRSAGSSAVRSKPVQALLALAESRGLGIPNAPGDRDELKRILWSHARSNDKAHSIKASAELMRIEADERATALEEAAPTLSVILAELVELTPICAKVMADQTRTPLALNERQQAIYNEFRRKIALEYLQEQRAQITPDAKPNGNAT